MKKYIKEAFKHLLRSYPFLRKYVREFETYYNMTPEELRERNNKRFLEILHVAYYKTSFYKKFYDDAGVDINSVRRIEDIGRLPVLTKDLVREYADEMRSKPKWMYVLQYTSGTTGTPLLMYVTWPAI